MLLRSAVLLCLASGFCLAADHAITEQAIIDQASAGDPFMHVFERAMPSPFSGLTGKSAPPPLMPDVKQFFVIPDSKQAVLEAAHSCAIPLVIAPIPKDKNYTVRKYEVPKAQFDDMARAPVAPVCPKQ